MHCEPCKKHCKESHPIACIEYTPRKEPFIRKQEAQRTMQIHMLNSQISRLILRLNKLVDLYWKTRYSKVKSNRHLSWLSWFLPSFVALRLQWLEQECERRRGMSKELDCRDPLIYQLFYHLTWSDFHKKLQFVFFFSGPVGVVPLGKLNRVLTHSKGI